MVRQAVAAVAELLGMSSERRDDLRLAVSEAATNVVVHAYPDRPGTIRIEVWPAEGEVVVHVIDHGTGIVPREDRVSPGLGLGIRLMDALADELLITPANNGPGTQVGMTFKV